MRQAVLKPALLLCDNSNQRRGQNEVNNNKSTENRQRIVLVNHSLLGLKRILFSVQLVPPWCRSNREWYCLSGRAKYWKHRWAKPYSGKHKLIFDTLLRSLQNSHRAGLIVFQTSYMTLWSRNRRGKGCRSHSAPSPLAKCMHRSIKTFITGQ